MWIVRLALRRPYSIAVFAALIFMAGIMSIQSIVNHQPMMMGDIAKVAVSFADQTNGLRINGSQAVIGYQLQIKAMETALGTSL